MHDLLVLFADPATQLYLAVSLLCVIGAGVCAALLSSDQPEEERDEE